MFFKFYYTTEQARSHWKHSIMERLMRERTMWLSGIKRKPSRGKFHRQQKKLSAVLEATNLCLIPGNHIMEGEPTPTTYLLTSTASICTPQHMSVHAQTQKETHRHKDRQDEWEEKEGRGTETKRELINYKIIIRENSKRQV